jgi:hypothetical protein
MSRVLGAQEYTSQLKNRTANKGIPQAADQKSNTVVTSIHANQANQVVKVVSDPTKSCSGGWIDRSDCCSSAIRGWFINKNGDGQVSFQNGNITFLSGPADDDGDGWTYIYRQFTEPGSFTYSYVFDNTSDDLQYDWPFEYVTLSDPSDEANIDAYISDSNNTYVTSEYETGTRTVTYSAGDYVVLGIFSDDSEVGRATLILSGLP